MAELFRLNPDKVVIDDTSAPIVDEPSPEIFDDVDEREKGIDYFKHPHDFKTFPGFEVNQLGMLARFSRQIQYEYRKRWVNFRPQQPERYYLPEIDGDTWKHKVILKWLSPKVMKKIPLRKMRQDFLEGFRWCYYEGRTGEAVMVLCKDKKWETERIFDPMWLTNLSHSDVKDLYRHQIFFDVQDMEQALQFMRVIRIWIVFRIHAGEDWKAISDKHFKKDASK
ncbi:hypothetical protein R6Q57_000001 [Mikania cordata]